MKGKKILVLGATGQQGGAVIRKLLADNHQLIGTTRSVNSDKSKELVKLGAKMVKLDFLDQTGIEKVMKKVDVVFAMTTPFEKGTSYEIEQGISIANAAKKAEVDHFIFSSVSDADQVTGISHFDSKYEIEKHIQSLGIPYTIVAPVFFMDNILLPWTFNDVKKGVLNMGLPPNRLLQQIAVDDIGVFVSLLIEKGREVFGERYNLAGDELTGQTLAKILSEKMKFHVQYKAFDPKLIMEDNEDLSMMLKWFNDVGYSCNISQLNKLFPELKLQSFETWVDKKIKLYF